MSPHGDIIKVARQQDFVDFVDFVEKEFVTISEQTHAACLNHSRRDIFRVQNCVSRLS